MRNTPCVECVYLEGDRGSYQCNSVSNRERLTDSIALGWEEDLPDCPFFLERQPADQFHPESGKLVVVKPQHRRRRKRDWTPPIKVNKDLEETRKELLGIIRRHYRNTGKWPSHPRIMAMSRFAGGAYVLTVLKKMVEDEVLERIDALPTSNVLYLFKIPNLTHTQTC